MGSPSNISPKEHPPDMDCEAKKQKKKPAMRDKFCKLQQQESKVHAGIIIYDLALKVNKGRSLPGCDFQHTKAFY